MDRRKRIFLLIFILVFLILIILWFAISETINISPLIIGDSIILFSLFIFVLLLFIITLFVLTRNIVKLFLEKKKKIIGAQLKSKLVLFFVGFSIIPAFLLFFFASGIISKNIEQWFKKPMASIMENAEKLKSSSFSNYQNTTLHYSEILLREVLKNGLFDEKREDKLRNYLIGKIKEYNLDLISCYNNKKEIVTILNPELPLYEYRNIPDDLILKGIINGEIFRTDKLGNGEVLRGGKSRSKDGTSVLIITGKFLDEKRFAPLRKIVYSLRKYKQLENLKDPIKATYILVFLLVTLFIIFSASWLGINLAKEVTVPIEKLAKATENISKGKLNTHVNYSGDDEFQFLVNSFNRMVDEISNTRRQTDYQKEELKKGKEFQESILQNIRAGIIVIDDKMNIVEVNAAGLEFLSQEKAESVLGENLKKTVKDSPYKDVFDKIENIKKLGLKNYEFEVSIDIWGEKKEIAIKTTHLRKEMEGGGELIIVLNDLTEFIRAKRLSDWKIIAEKVAHELKNPLTPIKLSAQRIIKNIEKDEKEFKDLAKNASVNIVSEISGIKNLLENFLSFARMPAPKFKKENINSILEETVNIFKEVHKDVQVEMELEPSLPDNFIDPQQMKRVFINLLNNSVEAMSNGSKIRIKTFTNNENIRIEVKDNGPGVPEEIRKRIFNPYFSTKEKGSGLGLSIVYQIIKEHRGKIFLDTEYKKGAKFIMEFKNERTKDINS